MCPGAKVHNELTSIVSIPKMPNAGRKKDEKPRKRDCKNSTSGGSTYVTLRGASMGTRRNHRHMRGIGSRSSSLQPRCKRMIRRLCLLGTRRPEESKWEEGQRWGRVRAIRIGSNHRQRSRHPS